MGYWRHAFYPESYNCLLGSPSRTGLTCVDVWVKFCGCSSLMRMWVNGAFGQSWRFSAFSSCLQPHSFLTPLARWSFCRSSKLLERTCRCVLPLNPSFQCACKDHLVAVAFELCKYLRSTADFFWTWALLPAAFWLCRASCCCIVHVSASVRFEFPAMGGSIMVFPRSVLNVSSYSVPPTSSLSVWWRKSNSQIPYKSMHNLNWTFIAEW